MALNIPQPMLDVMHVIVAIAVLFELPRSLKKIWGKITSIISKAKPTSTKPSAAAPTKNGPTTTPKGLVWFSNLFRPVLFWLLVVEVFFSGILAASDARSGLIAFCIFALALGVVVVNDDD